jgi:8-oxo-dGTP pyrophosphatase MutT (NUDIX family)
VAQNFLLTRIFQAWWRLQRPLTLGVRGVVVDDQGRVLLLRHTYTPGWHFPGGGVEKGESCAEALGRELVEEAGIIAAEQPHLVSVHDNRASFPNDHVLLYRIPTWSQTKASQRGEIAETGFFDPLAPPAGVTPGTNRRLAELFAGAAISERW